MSYSNSLTRGSGIKKTIQRNINNFSDINIQGGLDIKYTQGKKLTLSISGDSNIIDDVTTTVSGKTLNISINKSFSTSHPITVILSSPKINVLTINGGSNIELNAIKTDSLKLVLNGAIDLHANGTASHLDIKIIGSGDANMKSLISKVANASIEGSGDIQLTVTQKLNASISGAGDIIFFGHPSSIEKQVLGAGDIEAGD
jgi:hypothetical protein